MAEVPHRNADAGAGADADATVDAPSRATKMQETHPPVESSAGPAATQQDARGDAPPVVDTSAEENEGPGEPVVDTSDEAANENLDVASWGSQSEAGDSAYDELQSQTASVTSSILAGHWENGRRYHAYQSGQYLFPDDELEQERLDVKYAAIHLTYNNKICFAPLQDPQNALDVGTGTGIWAIDFAEEYPGCTVTAVDLSPIQPTWVPPNVKFEIDDAEQDWTWPENHFDYVHLRTMAAAVRDWPRMFRQAYRHTKPGGYIECQEQDYMGIIQSTSRNPGTAFLTWCTQQGRAAGRVGVNLRSIPAEKTELLRAAGFVDIQCLEFRCPIGPWAADKRMRDAGLLQLSAVLDGLEGLSLKLLKFYDEGWTKEELAVLIAKVRTELKSRECHAYWPVYVWYARKPE